jgi:hypothetical protein
MKKVLEVISNLKQEVTRRGTTLKSKSSVTCTIYETCLKSNETGAINFLFITELQINIIPLGSHTPLEMLLPLPVAVPEFFTRKCPQMICHDLLDVVHSSIFGVKFEFRKGRSHTDSGQASMGLVKLWNTFFGQKFVHGDGSTIGSFVVMEHPIVRNLWPDTMNPFSESFKELTVVLFNNCLSLRHDFLMNNTLVVEKTIAWI